MHYEQLEFTLVMQLTLHSKNQPIKLFTPSVKDRKPYGCVSRCRKSVWQNPANALSKLGIEMTILYWTRKSAATPPWKNERSVITEGCWLATERREQVEDAGLMAVHCSILAVTVWRWRNSRDVENVARWSEVICLGTEDILDRKIGVIWYIIVVCFCQNP